MIKKQLLFLFLLFAFSLYAGEEEPLSDTVSSKKNYEKISLTPFEKTYLKAKKRLLICVDPDWLPFDGIRDDKHVGLASDYMQIMSKLIGIPIILNKTTSWKESIVKAKNRECDMIPILSRTQERESYLDFTSTYLDVPIVIATQNDKKFIDSITEILDKKLAVVKNYSVGIYLKEDYPDIKLIEVDSILEGLKKVEKGEVYAYIDNLASINYELKNNFINRLKVSGRLNRRITYQIATRNDEPLLNGIMQKAIIAIDDKEKQDIYNRWISSIVNQSIDYSLIGEILFVVCIIILLFLYRQRELKKYNATLKEEISLKVMYLDEKNIQLQKSVDNFQTIFDLTMETIVLSDESGKIVSVNKSGINMLGYKNASEIIGTQVSSYVVQKYLPTLKKSLTESSSLEWEMELIRKDGSTIYVLASGKYIEYDDEKLRMSTILDISSTIQRDEAVHASKSKSEFLANMSHEIRTPLNAIMGFITLLKEETKNPKFQEYLSIIDSSSKNLLQIIEDILDFSKIESGKLEIEKCNFNAKEEFSVITRLFEPKCEEKGIRLILNIDNLPTYLMSDPLRIKQVISNLISNAIKFTSAKKKIVVSISYKDSYLYVSVEDEGIGIAEDKLQHIFEAFSQEDSSTTRKYGGTGLGLSISSALVKLLDGELKVESEQGKGSKFYFSLPTEIGNNIVSIEDDLENISFQNKKILVVEDNKANQMFVEIMLETLEVECDIADDGVEAIKLFRKHSYDLILMDENMPNKNGIEATQDILKIEQEENLVHTPIIALTANAIKGDRERFLEAGMDEYLTKPISKAVLAQMLAKFLNSN